MARNDANEDKKPKPPVPAQQPGSSLGGTLTAIGCLLIVGSIITESAGPMLYGGIALVVAGTIVWTINGISWRQELEWLKSGAVALALALAFRWAIAEPYQIPSQSMYPTLNGDERFLRGDRVWVNKFVYGVRVPFANARLWHGTPPQRWDIVVFNNPEPNAVHPTLVKRIVGLPGERIHVKDGKLWINGKALEVPPAMPPDTYYTSPASPYSDMKFGILEDDAHALVPPNCYLMMGDNSANSRDGRVFGWLPGDNMIGRVACTWWPPQRIRDFTGFSKTAWWRACVGLLLLYIALRAVAGRSAAVQRRDGGVNHWLMSYLHLGLRVPFTAIWLARWGRAQRGDLVLYRATPDGAAEELLLAGRVAGLGGERVLIENGQLRVNDAALNDPRLALLQFDAALPGAVYAVQNKKNTTQVPDGHVFILSDGPEDDSTLDSRNLGWIPEAHVTGKGIAVWWPILRK